LPAFVNKSVLHIGAMTFILTFGSSLKSHVHFHVCVVELSRSCGARNDLIGSYLNTPSAKGKLTTPSIVDSVTSPAT